MLVEIGEARDRLDDVGRFVHDDHCRRAEPGFEIAQRVEIHRAIEDLVGRQTRDRRTARNNRQEIVGPAANAFAMPVDKLPKRNAHLLLDIARPVDVAGNAEQLGAGVVGPAEPGEPAAPRRIIVPTTAMDSTLLTVVGAP